MPGRVCFKCGQSGLEVAACPVKKGQKVEVAQREVKLTKCTKCKSATHDAINCDEVKRWELNTPERTLRNFGKLTIFSN